MVASQPGHHAGQVHGVGFGQRVHADQADSRVRSHGGEHVREPRAGPAGIDRVGLVGQRRQQLRESLLGAWGQRRDLDSPGPQPVHVQQGRASLRGQHAHAGRQPRLSRGGREADRGQRRHSVDQFALVVRR